MNSISLKVMSSSKSGTLRFKLQVPAKSKPPCKRTEATVAKWFKAVGDSVAADEAVAELRRLVEQAERDDWNLTRGSQHARCVDSPPDRTDATLREGWRAPLFRGNSVSAFAARETATTRNPSLHRIEQGFRPVAHDGDRWPDLRFSDVIVVRFRSGKESRPGRASSFDWQWCHDEHDIVSWRPAADDEGPPVPYRRASTVPRVVP